MIWNTSALVGLLAGLLVSDAFGQQSAGNFLFCKRSRAEAGTYLADAEGQSLKKIMFLCGPDVTPRFAPDGNRILFSCAKAGTPWLWMTDREGQDRKAICEGDQGTWSPDGSRLFFRRRGQIFQRDLASGEEKTVSPPGWKSCAFPDCSPDGKHLLLCAETEGRLTLLVMTLEGRDQQVIGELSVASPARWSPDGRRIAYSDGASILIADRDGSRTYALAAHGGADRCPAWSPDGAMLVYCHAPAPRGGESLCVAKADGTSARVLAKGTLTEPGRDGLVRSNPRLLPYEDNVLSVFAADWRAAQAPPAALAAPPRPEPRITVWEVGRSGASDLAPGHQLLTQRAGWTPVSGTPVLRGALAVESARAIVVLGAGRGAATVCAKPGGQQAQTVEIVPVSLAGEEAGQVESLKLIRNDGQEAVVELCSSTPGGRKVRTSWKVGGDWPTVEIAAVENADRVRIGVPLEYVAIADRLADDLLYDPASCVSPRVALPAAAMSVGLFGSGDGELVVVCSSDRQTVDLLKNAGRHERFSGAEVRLAGERLIVGVLAGPRLWHAERPGVKYEQKRIDMNWSMPGPGAWRLAVRAGSRHYAEMFDQTQARRLDGTRLFLTEQEEFSGVVELALVYLYGGSPGTPPENLSPADLALHALGIEPFLRAMDIEGLQSYRMPPRQTTWADIFTTLESIRYLYENEVEKEEQGFADRLCDDVPTWLEGMDARLGEFAEFTRQVGKLAQDPETAQASSLGALIQPALDKLDEACRRRAHLVPAAEAAGLASQIKELTPKELPDKRKRFSELWQNLSRAVRGRADLIRAFRAAVRELSGAAGIGCAERPELRPAAGRLRQLAQSVLRDRYYFEGDWRGELQQEPPNWLGPVPY